MAVARLQKAVQPSVGLVKNVIHRNRHFRMRLLQCLLQIAGCGIVSLTKPCSQNENRAGNHDESDGKTSISRVGFANASGDFERDIQGIGCRQPSDLGFQAFAGAVQKRFKLNFEGFPLLDRH